MALHNIAMIRPTFSDSITCCLKKKRLSTFSWSLQEKDHFWLFMETSEQLGEPFVRTQSRAQIIDASENQYKYQKEINKNRKSIACYQIYRKLWDGSISTSLWLQWSVVCDLPHRRCLDQWFPSFFMGTPCGNLHHGAVSVTTVN